MAPKNEHVVGADFAQCPPGCHLHHETVLVDPGDDEVVWRVRARWVPSFGEVVVSTGADRCFVNPIDGSGLWECAFSAQREDDERRRQLFAIPVSPDGTSGPLPGGRYCWGLIRLGSGVWDIDPSVHVPTQIHAHVTLYGVPDPAPWEKP